MEPRTYRAAGSAYVVFATITGALAVLWLAAAWRGGVVTWGPLCMLAGVYAICALWLSRFRIELASDEVRVATPLGGERCLARADIVDVEFVAPATPSEGPFTLAIHVRDGSDLRLNAKLFSREAVAELLALAPSERRAA